MRALFVAAGAAALLVSGCTSSGPPPTASASPVAKCSGTWETFDSTGLSASSAGTLALRDTKTMGADGVITVLRTHLDDVDLGGGCGVSDGRAAWVVVVYGEFVGSCGPFVQNETPHPCPAAHTAQVFLDYHDGAQIDVEFPAPTEYQPPRSWSPPADPES